MQRNYDLAFRTSQKRWIYVPTDQCRIKGVEITDSVLSKWTPPEYFYHFRRGGHIAALEVHGKNEFFAKADIKQFFPSISRNRVLVSLKKAGFPFREADEMADWSCVVSKGNRTSRILPYGFIQSQILSALCMDKSAIGAFLRSLDPLITLSVYVDDIILSSNDRNVLDQEYRRLASAINQSGFILNEEKSHGTEEVLTAFNINLEDGDLKIEDSRFVEFMEAISATQERKSEAIISYVTRVSASQGNMLLERYRDIME